MSYNIGTVNEAEQTMEQFKSWEELTPLEQAQATWWDMYKDVYGVRPRGVDTSNWTLEGFIAQIETLSIHLKEAMEDERRAEQKAIEQFEALINKNIATGAHDRATALRWIMEASDCDGDWEYLCFYHNLPFNYFQAKA